MGNEYIGNGRRGFGNMAVRDANGRIRIINYGYQAGNNMPSSSNISGSLTNRRMFGFRDEQDGGTETETEQDFISFLQVGTGRNLNPELFIGLRARTSDGSRVWTESLRINQSNRTVRYGALRDGLPYTNGNVTPGIDLTPDQQRDALQYTYGGENPLNPGFYSRNPTNNDGQPVFRRRTPSFSGRRNDGHRDNGDLYWQSGGTPNTGPSIRADVQTSVQLYNQYRAATDETIRRDLKGRIDALDHSIIPDYVGVQGGIPFRVDNPNTLLDILNSNRGCVGVSAGMTCN